MHEIEVLGMPGFLESVEAALPRAQRRIFVGTYIIRNDRMGRGLGRGLAEAAQRGVDVRLLFDPHGSGAGASNGA